MEVKPEYKLTELGVIPEDWECCPISSVAQLESGHTPSKQKKSYWDGVVGWVSLHDTARLDDNEIHTTTRTITEEGLNNSSARMLPKGTVVFSRTATVGKATALGESMATSQDFANYVCGPNLNSLFLVYLFRSMKRTWAALMAGSIHNTIYMPMFKSLKIVRPPIGEQRAIAKALSDVDALLSALDRLITKKRHLKQTAMQQLLTGKTRLPGFNEEWKAGQFGDVVEALEAGVSVNSVEGEPDPDTSCVLKTSALSSGIFIQDECKKIAVADCARARTSPRRNTILVSRMNTPDLVGEIAYVPTDFPKIFLPDRIWMTRFRRDVNTNARWLAYTLSSRKYRLLLKGLATGTSGSMKNIGKNALFTLPVSYPSREEQDAIASVIFSMENEILFLDKRRKKTSRLKQGIMQELLTGKTRLGPSENKDD